MRCTNKFPYQMEMLHYVRFLIKFWWAFICKFYQIFPLFYPIPNIRILKSFYTMLRNSYQNNYLISCLCYCNNFNFNMNTTQIIIWKSYEKYKCNLYFIKLYRKQIYSYLNYHVFHSSLVNSIKLKEYMY